MVIRISVALVLICAGGTLHGDDMSADHMMPHSGVLGARFVSVGGGIAQSPLELRFIGDAQSGAEFRLNIPAPWTDSLGRSFSHDLFASISGDWVSGTKSMRWLEHPASYSTPSFDDDSDFAVDLVSESGTASFDDPLSDEVLAPYGTASWTTRRSSIGFSVGTTAFVSIDQGTRPFVQLGYQYTDNSFEESGIVDSRIEPGTWLRRWRDEEHRLLCNVGVEHDLARTLSLRGSVNLETKRAFDRSQYHAGVIWWVTPRLFIRPEIVGSFRGDGIGGLLTVGRWF